MALFSKEKRVSERERLLGQELEGSRYESIEQALLGELSIGSQDSKITRIDFPGGRQIVILSHAGRILLARDNSCPVMLSDFLYWTDLSEELKGILLQLSDGLPLNETLLGVISREAPESLTILQKAVLDSSFEALLGAHRDFAQHLTIDTDLFRTPQLVELLEEQALPLEGLLQSLESSDAREHRLLQMMGFEHEDLSTLTLKRTAKPLEEHYTLEKRFVVAAAEAEATVADTRLISNGFRWVTILQRLYELIEGEYITVHFAAEKHALPPIAALVERDFEVIFSLTLDAESNIDGLVDSVFEYSGDLELARHIAQNNAVLEDRLYEIEDWLIRELEHEEYQSFDDLSEEFQLTLRGLILERREINGKRTELLTRLRDLILPDSTTTEDELLRELIQLKLTGIAHAVDKLPENFESVQESDFHLGEESVEFNFNDGRISQDSDGEASVEHLNSSDEFEQLHESEPVDFEAVLQLAVQEDILEAHEAKTPVKPLDFDLLEEHIARLTARKSRKRG